LGGRFGVHVIISINTLIFEQLGGILLSHGFSRVAESDRYLCLQFVTNEKKAPSVLPVNLSPFECG
jgi:hypothetical protein